MCFAVGPGEGRELKRCLQCVELCTPTQSNGSIPSGAVRAYEAACDERLAMGGLCRADQTDGTSPPGTGDGRRDRPR